MVVSLVGSVWSFFGTDRKWLGLAAVGLNTIALIANFAASAPAIQQAVAIRHVENVWWRDVGVWGATERNPGHRHEPAHGEAISWSFS
jgi:hypothetical protein